VPCLIAHIIIIYRIQKIYSSTHTLYLYNVGVDMIYNNIYEYSYRGILTGYYLLVVEWIIFLDAAN